MSDQQTEQVKREWLSTYFYYASTVENFLVKAIKPFIRSLEDEGIIDGFFFIRYFEYAPHIRLRIRCDSVVQEERVKPRLIKHFNEFIRRNPSTRDDDELLKALHSGQSLKTNNTFEFISYEPEIERYGGTIGISIAEKQFEMSSRAVISALSDFNSWDYSRRLGIALQLHLGFSYAMRFSAAQANLFFNNMDSSWRPAANSILSLSQSKALEADARVPKVFVEAFEKQKKTLIPFMTRIWEGLNQGSKFEKKWFGQWVADMKRIFSLCENAFTSKPDSATSSMHPLSNDFVIVSSYAHMTNNRLGISNHDESYLAFILAEFFLEQMTEN